MRLILDARICRFAVLVLILTGLTLSALATDHPPLSGAADGVATSDLTQLSIEELMQIEIPTVVGASKHEQKVTEAPASVTIVTAEDIKRYGYRTLADLLNGVRGFYTTYDRLYNYAGIRGVNRPGDSGGRLLITVDGHRVNDPIFDQAPIGTDFILDLDLVERVEIIRGPGSSLYGNNAFFGIVNVVTRRGRDLKGTEASASVASYDTVTGRLTYGDRLDQRTGDPPVRDSAGQRGPRPPALSGVPGRQQRHGGES